MVDPSRWYGWPLPALDDMSVRTVLLLSYNLPRTDVSTSFVPAFVVWSCVATESSARPSAGLFVTWLLLSLRLPPSRITSCFAIPSAADTPRNSASALLSPAPTRKPPSIVSAWSPSVVIVRAHCKRRRNVLVCSPLSQSPSLPSVNAKNCATFLDSFGQNVFDVISCFCDVLRLSCPTPALNAHTRQRQLQFVVCGPRDGSLQPISK